MSPEERQQRGANANALIQTSSYGKCIQDMYDSLHEGLDCLPTDDPLPAMSILRQLRSLRLLDTKLRAWAKERKIDD